jgi:hypothetical protein
VRKVDLMSMVTANPYLWHVMYDVGHIRREQLCVLVVAQLQPKPTGLVIPLKRVGQHHFNTLLVDPLLELLEPLCPLDCCGRVELRKKANQPPRRR